MRKHQIAFFCILVPIVGCESIKALAYMSVAKCRSTTTLARVNLQQPLIGYQVVLREDRASQMEIENQKQKIERHKR